MGELMDATANMSHLTDDLLQWSDLLASLCLLGHDVTIKADRVELLRYQMQSAHCSLRLERVIPSSFYRWTHLLMRHLEALN